MTYTSCACDKCVDLCKYRPCWGTIEDIEVLISSGYSNRLMLDYWAGDLDSPDIYLLCPSIKGREGGEATFIPIGECTFLKDDLCEVQHIKPYEGKRYYGCKKDKDGLSHNEVANLWDNEKGKQLIEEWKMHDAIDDLGADPNIVFK